jgi:hypothetical protein
LQKNLQRIQKQENPGIKIWNDIVSVSWAFRRLAQAINSIKKFA